MVIEATGGGHVALDIADAIDRAAQQIPIVLASRTGAGEVSTSTYGFKGGEIDLLKRGVIRAGWLDGLKAKILLTLLLRMGQSNRRSIAQAFSAWDGGME